VTWLAERLPVGAVPEERAIALVWDDVVDDRGSGDVSSALAIGAEWVRCEVCFAGFVPTAVVAPIPSRRTGRVGCTPSNNTVRVTAAARNESGTAGVSARALCGKWQLAACKTAPHP